MICDIHFIAVLKDRTEIQFKLSNDLKDGKFANYTYFLRQFQTELSNTGCIIINNQLIMREQLVKISVK